MRNSGGRFAIPVLHLWHKENDQSNEQENYKRMIARANDNSIKRADIGIVQYLKASYLTDK